MDFHAPVTEMLGPNGEHVCVFGLEEFAAYRQQGYEVASQDYVHPSVSGIETPAPAKRGPGRPRKEA